LDADYFEKNRLEENVPVIIWWTPFTMNMGSYRTCSGGHKCFFTNVRRYREAYRSRNKALLFYGPNFQLHDLPMPRLKNEHWGLLHDESPSSNYLFSFDEIIRMFNHTSTFRRHSDLNLLTQHLSSVDDLESTMYLISTSEKNRLQVEKQLAPVAYVQSDCATPSDRDTYVKALMKYIGVDSYGSCLHNKDLPQK
jgi:alpha-1,3-fucosyltransferase 10